MANFIKLHKSTSKSPVYISPKYIVRFGETTINSGNSYLVLGGEKNTLYLSETVDELIELLNINQRPKFTEEQYKKELILRNFLDTGLSKIINEPRLLRILRSENIITVGDLNNVGLFRVLRMRDVGKVALMRLKEELNLKAANLGIGDKFYLELE